MHACIHRAQRGWRPTCAIRAIFLVSSPVFARVCVWNRVDADYYMQQVNVTKTDNGEYFQTPSWSERPYYLTFRGDWGKPGLRRNHVVPYKGLPGVDLGEDKMNASYHNSAGGKN